MRKKTLGRVRKIVVFIFIQLMLTPMFVPFASATNGRNTTGEVDSSPIDVTQFAAYDGTSHIFQNAVDRFVSTDWKTESDIAPVNNTSQEKDAETVPVSFDSLGLHPLFGTGKCLYSTSCDNTFGWLQQSSWPGEQVVNPVQTGVALLVNNGRFESSAIPPASSGNHGAMWSHQLTECGKVGDGLDLLVTFQHEYVYGYMGHVGVAVYDTNFEVIFKASVTDAWYGSTSRVYATYYYLDWLGGGSTSQMVQKYGSWSGDVRIWYERESDEIKANILGNAFTVVSNPHRYELERSTSYLVLYFSNKEDYNYDSKFIDSIDLWVEASPATGWPAGPQDPSLEGHWFPQTSYSRLYFKVNQPYIFDSYFLLWLRIEADQDTIERYLTVKVDDVQIYHERIHPATGFDGSLQIYGSGVKKIMIEIHYGGYKDKGWILKRFAPERTNGEPLEILGEYFPQFSYAQLVYRAKLGEDSKINFKVENAGDTILRYVTVYVDGQEIDTDYAPGAYEWDLGDYTYESIHEICIEIHWGGYCEWGKILTINRVHFFTAGVEIDYMSGHAPSQSDLNQLTAYYITLGPHRVDFQLDDVIPHQDSFEPISGGDLTQAYWDMSDAYRDHNEPKWEWMVFVHYLLANGQEQIAFHISYDYGIFINDGTLQYYAMFPWTPSIAAFRRTTMLHEYGHHIHIIDRNFAGQELYCFNSGCAMAALDIVFFGSVSENPWYCEHHWTQYYWSGW